MSFEAIRLSTVRYEDLKRVLIGRGCIWESAGHVTPSSRLGVRIAKRDGCSIPIASLIDMIVVPGAGEPISEPAPRPRSGPHDDDAIRMFRQRLKGKRVIERMKIDREIYRLRCLEPSSAAESLWHGRREFGLSLERLISSGMSPDNVQPGVDALASTAQKFWRAIENSVPSIAAVRRDIWTNPNEVRDESTEHAIELKRRISAALDAAFGATKERRTIVYHGFYYYTPVQWALFQLLRGVANVDQLFVVHDDGECEAFESWRRYFDVSRDMPLPKPVACAGHSPTPMAQALQSGLAARLVEPTSVGSRLEIGWYADFAAFSASVRDRRRSESLFAAGADELEARLGRMDNFEGRTSVDLASLPPGNFLVRLHECMRPIPGGGHQLVLTADIVRDIVASGCLALPKPQQCSRSLLPVIVRALPYFDGCSHPDDWEVRANHLVKLIGTDVSRLGARKDGATDVERINTSVANPFARVPWCDLSASEVNDVRVIICCISSELKALFKMESGEILLEPHFHRISARIEEALSSVSKEEAERIRHMMNGAADGLIESAPSEIVVDVVNMLLQRKSSLVPGTSEDPDSWPLNLRELDSVGFEAEGKDIHVANLADGMFPAEQRGVDWPFPPSSIVGGPPQSHELMRLRATAGMLGDLYLLWLALDGVEAGRSVHLSWMKEIDREPRSHSSILTLIAQLELPSDWQAVQSAIGGIPVRQFRSGVSDSDPELLRPLLAMEDADGRGLTLLQESPPTGIDPLALACAVECPRRFAMQWLCGPTASFAQRWLQLMAFGNVFGSLLPPHRRGWRPKEVDDACRDLWRQFPDATLESSLRHAVVGERSAKKLASPVWLLTLRSGDAFERAKLVDKGSPVPELVDLTKGSGRALPLGLLKKPETNGIPNDELAETCKYCPVNDRCMHRVRDEWY